MQTTPKDESAQDNFGKLINQFQSKTKTLIRKLGRIFIKLYRQNVSLLFNQTYIYIYIYICYFYFCLKSFDAVGFGDK